MSRALLETFALPYKETDGLGKLQMILFEETSRTSIDSTHLYHRPILLKFHLWQDAAMRIRK